MAQPFGNEWIDYSQTYYKIPVARAGVYRLNKAAMDLAGIPTNSITRGQYQLWHRGREMAISVTGTAPNLPLGASDFIEFYADRANGDLDSSLYLQPRFQPHRLTALHNDTAAYFLTWTRTGSPKRMASYNENRTNVPLTNWHLADDLALFRNNYAVGKGYLDQLGSQIQHSYFDRGEGWTSNELSTGAAATFAHSFNGIVNVTSNVQAFLDVVLVGRNGTQHNVEITGAAPNANPTVLRSLSFRDFESPFYSIPLPPNSLTDAQYTVTVRALAPTDGSTAFNRIAVAYLRLRYAQSLNFNNALQDRILTVASSSTDYHRLNFSGVSASVRVFDIEDPYNQRILTPITPISGGLANFAVDGALRGRKLILNYTPVTVPASGIKLVRFRSINPNGHDFIILSHPALRLPVGSVQDPVREYANYRASVAGGRHDTLVLNQQEVNDQFGYGEVTPLATRNLAAYMLRGRGKYLLLLGKARLLNMRSSADYEATNLVYSFGVPGSDALLTAGLAGSGVAPALATGRIAATSPAQVLTYLNKLREHEAVGFSALWRKNTLVLTGGKLGEADGFKFYGQNYQRELTSRFLGSRAELISREDATSIIESINISDKVNKGLSLIALFGHSSPAGSDIDIGNASEPAFTNQGRYPSIILNGCAAGNHYTTGSFVLAENWLFTPNRGAVSFIASTDLGLASNLDNYMSDFIKVQFQDSLLFNEPVGVALQNVVKRYMNRSFLDAIDTTLVDQFCLQGDPALKIFGAPKCDLKTSNAELFLRDRQPTTSDPVIRFGVVVSNLGRTHDDSISIRYKRTLADGRELTYIANPTAPIYYQDTLYFEIPKPDGNSGGLNKLEVNINYTNRVDELRYDNNTAVLEFVLPESGLTTLFPEKYGIVGNPTGLRLVAQSNNLFAASRRYLFECDTTTLFNSPIKQNLQTSGTNLASVTLSLPVRRDSIVYHWRVRFEDIQAPSDTTWYTSSFTFITGRNEGWSQGHFPQFSESEDVGISKDFRSRTWSFTTSSINLRIEAAGGGVVTNGRWEGSNVFLNGVNIFAGSDRNLSCYPNFGFTGIRDARIITLGLDRNTLGTKPFVTDPVNDFRQVCGRQPFSFNFWNYFFGITQENFQGRLFRGQAGNPGTLNPGDLVVVMNSGDWPWRDMASLPRGNNNAHFRLYRALVDIGVDTTAFTARSQNGFPCIMIGRKGGSYGSARVLYANTNSATPPRNQTLTVDTNLTTRSVRGEIRSSRIGPARRWQSLSYNISQPTGSITKLQVIGASLTGAESVLIDSANGNNLDLSSIDPTQYPYLYLRLVLTNEMGAPPQLKRWTVLYESVPEGSLNTLLSGQVQFTIPDKQEGEKLNLKVVFQNISSRAFPDTIGVRVRVRNTNGKQMFIPVPPLRALGPNDTGSVQIRDFSTIGWGGSNSVQVFFNPQLQPELIYTNNSIDVPFRVKVDRTNPVLDVTFDGSRIIDGDIVSPTPAIAMVLRDENRFLPKTDTLGLNITLSRVGGTEPARRISFANGEARLTPATASSPLRVDYTPQRLENGTYNLRVQGEDASGNKSGLSDYAINFQVVNESSVTHFYPYPNPFSSSTRFVFTLTGAEVPSDIKIQIMTVSGRIVREITRHELGPVRIGNNISQFAWDGTDEFGDKLGNGVYLYRVFVQQNGQNVEHRSTAADDTFKNGIGKIYLMR